MLPSAISIFLFPLFGLRIAYTHLFLVRCAPQSSVTSFLLPILIEVVPPAPFLLFSSTPSFSRSFFFPIAFRPPPKNIKAYEQFFPLIFFPFVCFPVSPFPVSSSSLVPLFSTSLFIFGLTPSLLMSSSRPLSSCFSPFPPLFLCALTFFICCPAILCFPGFSSPLCAFCSFVFIHLLSSFRSARSIFPSVSRLFPPFVFIRNARFPFLRLVFLLARQSLLAAPVVLLSFGIKKSSPLGCFPRGDDRFL